MMLTQETDTDVLFLRKKTKTLLVSRSRFIEAATGGALLKICS